MSLENDVEKLETAIMLFAQTIKRPQRWAMIAASAGISIDRPSAIILHTLAVEIDHRYRVQELAAELGIEAPSITRKTQELERAGYIVRRQDPSDKRAVELTLTRKGRSVSNRLWKAQRAGMQQAMSNWSNTDRQQFVTLFQKFSSDLANDRSVSTISK